MGIFDGIIAQEQNNTATTSTIVPDNNDEILIIDDQMNSSIFNADISSTDIPDSAISFFDEPKVDTTDSLATIEEPITNEVLIQDDTTPVSEIIIEETWFWKIENSTIMSQITTSDIWNPNDVLVNAISSLEAFLAWHEQTIWQKMSTIETKQEEITKLKQDIKALNEEAKIISEEKMKVEKMIELFKSQRV